MDAILPALPALNAFLNAVSAVLIALGYVTIRRGQKRTHKRLMLSAGVVSAVFLVSYVTKTILAGTTYFGGTGLSRVVYLSVLFSHLTLAIALVPMAIITLSSALSNRFDRHRRIARWTLPLWLYVSVTGVLVYFMLRPWYS